MPTRVTSVVLTPEQKQSLQKLIRADSTTQALALRVRIVLASAQGLSDTQIASQEQTSRVTVGLWRKRFLQHGMRGLQDKARPGRPVILPASKINTVLTAVVQPPKGRTRWSIRSMARHAGVSKSRVQALWSQNNLKPHLIRTFKLSNDSAFEPKFWDVIGLYLNPPHKALVLCCDEKSQCQALERTQPGLPLGVGHIRTRTHDYTRHGTMTLFAALKYLDGKILNNSLYTLSSTTAPPTNTLKYVHGWQNIQTALLSTLPITKWD